MVKHTIIIPVFNAEKFLRRCLDSVLAQTHKDWECICVDDGSTDTSGAICDEYAEKDVRFRVFHQENGGVGRARNKGIDESQGEYICFVDADDEIRENYLSMMSTILDNVPDIGLVECSHCEIYEHKSDAKRVIPPKTIGQEDYIKLLFSGSDGVYHGYTPTKMFRSKIIKDNKLHFNEDLKYNEDRSLITYYTKRISSIQCIPDMLYFYYRNDLSAMGKLFHVINEKTMTELESFAILLKDDAFNPTEKKYISKAGTTSLMKFYNITKSCNVTDKSVRKIIRELQKYAKIYVQYNRNEYLQMYAVGFMVGKLYNKLKTKNNFFAKVLRKVMKVLFS